MYWKLFRAFALVSIIGCSTKPKEVTQYVKIEPEDFKVFYERFHTDTAFQNSRMTVPDGLNGHVNVHEFDTARFTLWQQNLESMFIEKITLKADQNKYLEYVFQMDSGKWKVIKFYNSYN